MNTPQHNPVQHSGTDLFKMVGNWDTQSKHLKEKYSLLTDADLKFETGKENDLLTRVGNRLNKNRAEVITILKKGQPETK